MQLTSLITAAGLAVSTTSAFLLPLSESSDSDTITTLPVPFDTDFKIKIPHTAEVQKLELPCPGCPLRVGHHKDDGVAKIKTDIPSHLDLSFTVDHAADSDRLMLNDFELYPRSFRSQDVLGAQLVPDHKHGEQRLPGHRKQHMPFMQPLGYALSTAPVAKSSDDDLELVQIDLQIIEVGNVFVDGVPTIQIKVIKTPGGGLLIGGIETAASESLMKSPIGNMEECPTMLCRWRAMLSAQMARFRSHKCGGKNGSGHATGQLEGVHRHPHSGHGHAHGHGGQQHRHRFVHLLRNIASHILLPIAVGIAAGVTASVIGMMVGSSIVFLWRTFVRPAGTRRHHHRRGHSTHKAARKEAVVEDEKAGLMTNQEPEADAPPAYIEEGLVENNRTTENQS